MNKIKFNRSLRLIEKGIYDDMPDKQDYYEYDYLLINPTLHSEDSEDKFRAVKKFLDVLIPSIDIDTVADIGCGSCIVVAKTLDYLQKKVEQNVVAVGIDISANMLFNSVSHPHLVKLRADCKDIPLENQSICISVCIDILEHVKNPQLVLKEIARISRFAFFKVPLELSFFTIFKGGHKRLKRLEKKYGHIHHYDRNIILNLIENNFEPIYESYEKIPNRVFVLDKIQNIIISLKLYRLFALIFGGFIIIGTKSKGPV